MMMMMFGFLKAFDKVPQRDCYINFMPVELGKKIMAWMEEWLNGHVQKVVLNVQCSNSIPVLSSVLQGSVLRLVLFIIYVNDIDLSLCVEKY